MTHFFVWLSYLFPFIILYILFRLTFIQIKGWFARALLISFILYATLFSFSIVIFISQCFYGCRDGIEFWFRTGIEVMGFGLGMIVVVPLYCLLNGILFASKKSLELTFIMRLLEGVLIAFIFWLFGAIILYLLGFYIGGFV